MVKKEYIQNIISKYNLDGNVETVKWEIKDNTIIIKFISNNKDLVGIVTASELDIKKCDLAIFDTQKLLKLISIMGDNIMFEPIKEGSTFAALLMDDKKYDVSYFLANPLLVPKFPKIEEPKYDFVADLFAPDLLSISKAISALPDVDNITISSREKISGENFIEFIIGNDDKHSNKIKFNLEPTANIICNGELFSCKYKPELMKPILQLNKGSETAKIHLSKEGLMKLEFKETTIDSVYYLIPKEN